MKVVVDFNLSAWITGVEIEARSYEDAKQKLAEMTFDEIVELGYAKEFSVSDIDGQVVEKQVKVKIYDIEYDLEEDDYSDPEDYIKVLNSLPAVLTATLTMEPDDDIEDLIADEIFYQTKQTVNSFKFMTIEEN